MERHGADWQNGKRETTLNTPAVIGVKLGVRFDAGKNEDGLTIKQVP